MLLPSALDCAPLLHPSYASHTPATEMLSPPASSCHSPTSQVSPKLHSACRSLQSLITTNLPTSTSLLTLPPRAQSQLASPIKFTTSTRVHSRKPARAQTPPARCAMIAEPQTLDQRLRKRQRLCDDDDEAGPGQDQENIARAKPSTPKRQRLYPPSLPLGLERADFDALQDQAANVPLPQTPPDRPHNTSKKEEDEENWCSSDDSALVSMILHKLRLRQSDWDDCARRLGKGKGSIGERLKMLVGDGEVGLRRGKGRKKRGSVVKMEFGGPLHPE